MILRLLINTAHARQPVPVELPDPTQPSPRPDLAPFPQAPQEALGTCPGFGEKKVARLRNVLHAPLGGTPAPSIVAARAMASGSGRAAAPGVARGGKGAAAVPGTAAAAVLAPRPDEIELLDALDDGPGLGASAAGRGDVADYADEDDVGLGVGLDGE